MKRVAVVVTSLALLLTLGLGCGQGQAPAATNTPSPSQPQATAVPSAPSPTEPSKATAATAVPTKAPAPSPTASAAAQSAQDLLAKAEWLANFSCELITTTPDNKQITAFLALKGKKMRMDLEAEGQKMVWIADSDTKSAVMYNPADKTGMKFPFDQFEQQTSGIQAPDDIITEHPEGKIVGEETIDGKPCVVYEYKDANASGKAWIWKDKAFPLKGQVTTQGGTSTIEYKNVTLGGVDDKLFEVPSDVKLLDLSTLPGMPTPGS